MIPLVFTKYSFPVLGSYLGYYSNGSFGHHVSLDSSWLCPFLSSCLFLKSLTAMKGAAQKLLEWPWFGIWDTSDIFLMIGFQRKTTKVKVKTISITLYQGYLTLNRQGYQQSMSYHFDVTLVSWLRKYLSGFSTVKLSYPLPLSALYSLGEKNH